MISEYDPDLKVSNGTAKIDLDDGSQMLVIFGRQRLKWISSWAVVLFDYISFACRIIQ